MPTVWTQITSLQVVLLFPTFFSFMIPTFSLKATCKPEIELRLNVKTDRSGFKLFDTPLRPSLNCFKSSNPHLSFFRLDKKRGLIHFIQMSKSYYMYQHFMLNINKKVPHYVLMKKKWFCLFFFSK